MSPLTARGHDVVVPDDHGLQLCVAAIAAIKGNRPELACGPAADCVQGLIARGADSIVLDCTELPLALPNARQSAFGVGFTDSIDALARAAIALYRAGALARATKA